MPTYEQNKKSIQKYIGGMDRLNVWLPKGEGLKDALKDHAASMGESMQAFVARAIRETMYRDKHQTTLDGDIPPAIRSYIESKKAGE